VALGAAIADDLAFVVGQDADPANDAVEKVYS
jgi:hypothetical protein